MAIVYFAYQILPGNILVLFCYHVVNGLCGRSNVFTSLEGANKKNSHVFKTTFRYVLILVSLVHMI